MLNITKHAMKRYVERVKKVQSDLVDQTIIDHKDVYTVELNKMVRNAKFIHQGKFNENNEARFYLAESWLLVLDKVESKIITLYKVDFSFSSDINKMITKSLLDELELATEKYELSAAQNREQVQDIESKELQMVEEIKSLEDTLKKLRESLRVARDYKRNIDWNTIQAKNELDIVAKKIVYSIEYKIEMEKIKP